ncbi:MAG: nucleotide exchange factor GrpE [Melioribacteraceae bacterium]|nr:nucleotide exchange factor GrpE [Melioribacteraceae bacterium]
MKKKKEKNENDLEKDVKITEENAKNAGEVKDSKEKSDDIKELTEALNKITELEAKNTELNNQLLRRAAEFENYKRRTENDQLNILKYAAEGFILNVLPIYNDLEKSISHIDDENNMESFKEGIRLIFNNFQKTLDEQGIKKIKVVGEEFNVDLHEALMQQEVPGTPANIVVHEVEAGFMYKDKVIKHSKVIVSQEVEAPAEENESNENNNEESK